MISNQWPPFDDLPLDPNGPAGNAWGLFGTNDQLGRLNLLTPETIVTAAREIQSGIRISLDLPLDQPKALGYGRLPLRHEICRRGDGERPVNDDVLHFNTQSSSQWDGFRHYGYLRDKLYYGGYTNRDVIESSAIGIDAWAENGGITGRGVLLDYASYAQRRKIVPRPFESTAIPLSDLLQIALESNVTFHTGDILLIRTGFIAAYGLLSASEEADLADRSVRAFIGIESSKAMLRWLWDSQFAAVAADSPAFESSPLGQSARSDMKEGLHQWLLAGWGMPIGELFNLEQLAKHCSEVGRWTFFLSSVPLKVPGGVASPPNAVAIF